MNKNPNTVVTKIFISDMHIKEEQENLNKEQEKQYNKQEKK